MTARAGTIPVTGSCATASRPVHLRPDHDHQPPGSSSRAKRRGMRSRLFQPISVSHVDWLGPSILTAKTVASAAEALPFPYVKAVFVSVVVLLETVEKVKKNRDDLQELCKNAIEIMDILQDRISSDEDTVAVKLKGLCEEFESVLQNMILAVKDLQSKSDGFRGNLKEFFLSSSITDQIAGYQKNIQDLCSRLKLTAAIDTNIQVHKILATVITPSIIFTCKVCIKSDLIFSDLTLLQAVQKTNTCPPPSRIFQGRQNILNKMHQYFTTDTGKQHIYVLHGLGGAGKTQIALKFIKQSLSHFSNVFMVDTSTSETIDTGLKNIAVAKQIGDSSRDALDWLTSKVEDWLLFFDNADDPGINLHDFIPQCGHGNILITSRNPGLCVYAGSHSHVSDMDEEDAVTLLLTSAAQEVSSHNQQIATEIVKALDYLALAIIQAGAFISKSGALDSYLDLYTRNRAQLLSEKPAQAHDHYAWTVYTTWQMSFTKLSHPAATFLQLCSFLHHKGISEDIFCNASMYRFQPTGPSEEELQNFLSHFVGPTGEWDSLRFLNVTSEIKAYSLISFDSETKMFSIHPLVHAWSQTMVSDLELYQFMAGSILGMAIAKIPNQDLQLASLRLLAHVESVQMNTGGTSNFWAEYGQIFYKATKFKKAEKLQMTLLEKQIELLGENHLDTLCAMSDLAKTHKNLGELKKAEKLELAVLEKRKQFLGENHPLTLHAMGNLGTTYKRLGKFQRAKELEVVVLEKQRELLGENHPDTLRTMRNLASTYSYLGELQKAEELEIVVLDKQTQLLGENHPYTLCAMGNLASTYSYLGELQKAKDLEIVALEKQKELWGENHLDTLCTMENLGITYKRLGEFQRAEELEVVVLEKLKQFLGENHPDTLRAMGNLAGIFYELGDFQKAEELEIVVLEKRKQLLGENHPYTLCAMGNLASTYSCLGKLQKAEELEIVVLGQQRELLGENHPDTLRTMGNLASTYSYLGELQKAEELEIVVLEKRKQLLGKNHPYTLRAMGNLAGTHKNLGELKKAEELEIVALEKQRELLGENHPDTLRTMGNLASTYSYLGELQKAEELETVVLEKQKQLLGEDHPYTLRAMGNLAGTHKNLGELKKAEELETVALEKQRELLGENHPDTLRTMGNLASTYSYLGELQMAEELEIVVVEKRKQLQGENHPETLCAMENLAFTYRSLSKVKEAEELEKLVENNTKY
ncbi:hypothetical protein B0H13DRAFT_2540395 [Mycena leptocephala]|nr:hypothetical protein B0H13DRAFT_2540395 [Mycena leptocephala]